MKLFNKLSLMVTQGQKCGAPSENQIKCTKGNLSINLYVAIHFDNVDLKFYGSVNFLS